jgi:ubiquinone/menaquinone biosynthesis C-methylase UbiE
MEILILKHICNMKRRISSKMSFKKKVWNKIIDHSISSINEKNIKDICSHYIMDFSEQDYWEWIGKTILPFRNIVFPHKKALEFFFSSTILQLKSKDHVMDAAGGRSDYLDMVKNEYGCRNKYLTDHIYTGTKTKSDGLTVVGGDISQIHLPNKSLTKISCHHAFEHFQGDRDIGFIREIGRLLKPKGKACIIPLFLTDRYAECWNTEHKALFDVSAELIVDKSSSIPGADDDGHFARFYSADALKYRVVAAAKDVALRPSIVTCRLDGCDLPDMEKNFGSKLNYPLRALVLEKT